MTGHTKEPWAFQYDHDYTLGEVNGFFVQGADGKEIFYADNDDRPETWGNLKRSAECVTALAGIENPAAFVQAARGMAEAADFVCQRVSEAAITNLLHHIEAFRAATGEA